MGKTILILAASMACLLMPAFGQQQAQAGAEPITLQRENRTATIKPGRRIAVVGRSEDLTIRGRLVTATDSITIQAPLRGTQSQVYKVAVPQVREVSRRRLGWKLAGFYFLFQAIFAFATDFLLFLPVSALIITFLQVFFGVIVIALCFYLGFHKYRIPPWKIG